MSDNEGGEVGGLKGSLSGRCIINDRQLFKRAVLSKIVCNQMIGVLAALEAVCHRNRSRAVQRVNTGCSAVFRLYLRGNVQDGAVLRQVFALCVSQGGLVSGSERNTCHTVSLCGAAECGQRLTVECNRAVRQGKHCTVLCTGESSYHIAGERYRAYGGVCGQIKRQRILAGNRSQLGAVGRNRCGAVLYRNRCGNLGAVRCSDGGRAVVGRSRCSTAAARSTAAACTAAAARLGGKGCGDSNVICRHGEGVGQGGRGNRLVECGLRCQRQGFQLIAACGCCSERYRVAGLGACRRSGNAAVFGLIGRDCVGLVEQIVGVDRQSFCYVADNRFKAAVLLGDGNNGIRSRLLEFRLNFFGGADTVCARRERQLDRAVLANLSGCAVDCTGVGWLNRCGVGEVAGAVRAGDCCVVLLKVGEVNADGLVGIECVNINWIDKIYTINLYSSIVFCCGNVTLGNRPLFDHLLGVWCCSEGDFTAVRLLGLRVNRGVVNLGGQMAVLTNGAESKLIACRNLKVYGCSNILVRTDFAFRIGFGVSGSFFAVYFPLFNLIASLRRCMEGDFLILINGYAFCRHSLCLDFHAVDIIQRIRYRAVAGRSGSLGSVGIALGKCSADGQIVGQFADGVNAVGFLLYGAVYNPVIEVIAAFCACLQLNLAAAGNLGQIVHSFAVYGCNDRAMLHFRCCNRKCGTVGLERNLGILSDGEGIAAVSVELSCFNSLAVHLIGLARGGSIACLGRYRNPGIAGDAVAALERLGKRLGGIVRINRLIACGQFTFQRQRVAVALKYGSQINILHANLNRERVGAVIVRGAGRITVCTAFRENPLLEVPAGVRRCGEVELCTAGNVSREVLEAFGAIFIRAFECTALLILNGSIQFGIGGLEVNQNRCRF